MRQNSTREFGISSEPLKTVLAFAGTLLLLGLMLCHSWYGPDIWYHLSWGRSLVAQGEFLPQTSVLLQQPIVANIYWLFQIVIFQVVELFGILGGSLFFMFFWFLIALNWLATTQAMKSKVFGPLFFLAFVCCAQLRFEQRPEVISYFILSLLLLLLKERDLAKPLDGKFLFKIFVLQVVWSNCHGYFALGPLIGVGLIVANLWQREASVVLRTKNAALCALALLIGSVVSPFTWHNWQLVWQLMDVGRGLREVNAELMPPQLFPIYWPMPLFWVMFALTTIWSGRAIWRRNQSFAALMSLAGAALALQATRNIPLQLLLSAPALAGVLSELECIVRSQSRWLKALIYYSPLALALALSVSVATNQFYIETRSLATFGIHLERASYPQGVVEFLHGINFEGKIFADSYDGGFIEFYLPEAKVAGDSYFTDVAMTLDYFRAIKQPDALLAMDQRLGFDAMVINIENAEVIEALWKNSSWRVAYVDSHRFLFLRQPQYASVGFNLETMHLYGGEDLRHVAYGFGVISWAGMALKLNNVTLALKVLGDTAAAPVVPSTMVRYILGMGVRTKSPELIDGASSLLAKSYESNPGDMEKIRELQHLLNKL